MKAGYLQFEPVLNNLDKTIEKIDNFLTSDVKADLIVLPELANSGYNFRSMEEALESSEEIENSRFIKYLTEKAEILNTHIVAGFNERDGDKLYNSSVLVGPNGYIGKYRKIHLFYNEKNFFEPGDKGPEVFDIGCAKIGMLICFDWMFPELWRILSIKGADIICHPSNLVLPGFAQKAVPIHALTNHVFEITANRIGTEDNLTFTGMSTISDPKGNVMCQDEKDTESLKIVEMDLSVARDKNITPRNNILEDRRPELYKDILNLI